MQSPNLSNAQRKVMLDKATQLPFSGKYISLKQEGTYVCANCGVQLFSSANKYDPHCVRPSFDGSLAGSTTYTKDTSHSMVRTEITCASAADTWGTSLTTIRGTQPASATVSICYC